MKRQIYSNTTGSAEFYERPVLGDLDKMYRRYWHIMFGREITQGRETLL